MTKEDQYRKVIGGLLRDFRIKRGLSIYKVAKRAGAALNNIKAVEQGSTNYTIDSFFEYIAGCDLYIYFAEKSEDRSRPHDFEDIMRQGIQDPE